MNDKNKLFGNLSNEGLETTGDVLGGAGPVDSAAYNASIKMAYAIKSDKGAHGIVLQLELAGGRNYNETLYITNRAGENFYTKGDKKFPLPGFTTVNDLCLLATGLPLADQDSEEKIVKIYDYNSKTEIPTKVPVLVSLLGKEVKVGILKEIVDKNVKNDAGEYVPGGETREANVIDKVFHADSGKTVSEYTTKVDEAAFLPAWEKKNTGNVRNKAKGAEGKTGTPGKPAATGGGKPGTKSLFS